MREKLLSLNVKEPDGKTLTIRREFLMNVASIAGIKGKGLSDKELAVAFQKKYNIKETGELDTNTISKMESVAASRGGRHAMVKPSAAEQLVICARPLSVNKISDDVKGLQKDLAYLGYKVSVDEHKEGLFGKTTVQAVKDFQKDHHLPENGKLDRLTMVELNTVIHEIKPVRTEAAPSEYTIKGSVHDELWQPMSVLVKVSAPDGTLLAEHYTNGKGFFNILFPVPSHAVKLLTKSGWAPFKVKVGLYKSEGKFIYEREVECSTSTTWSNFTEQRLKDGTVNYDGICKGECEYEVLMKQVKVNYGEEAFEAMLTRGSVIMKEKHERIGTNVSKVNRTPLTQEKLSMLIVANIVSRNIGHYRDNLTQAVLEPDVIYGLIRSGLLDMRHSEPAFQSNVNGLSRDKKVIFLQEFSAKIVETMFFEPLERVSKALNNAIESNYIYRKHQLNGQTWSESVSKFVSLVLLKKRFLEDSSNLKDIIGCTAVPKSYWLPVGFQFSSYRSLSDLFLTSLKASGYINAVQRDEFDRAIRIGHLVLNKPAYITAAGNKLQRSYIGMMAKWTSADLKSIGIKDGEIPKVCTRIKETYPDEVFITGLFRKDGSDPVFKLLYDGLMFRNDSTRLILSDFDSINNLSYSDKEIAGMDTKRAVGGVRRIYALTDDVSAAFVLWKAGLTSAISIHHQYRKDEFLKFMSDNGIAEKTARSIYDNVEKQYVKVVSFYNEYRSAALKDSSNDKQANLKNLFGSQDAYDYDKSMSLIGQSAYYADLLRFLKKMPSEDGRRSAFDILVKRRPDLIEILLETRNSETLVPYIDLVCELLEGKVLEWTGSKVSYHNTADDSETLLALPAYVSKTVYQRIYEAPYPATTAHFNLYQEEIRAYLKALGIPRYKIMEAYGAPEAQVAAEYFGLSWLEYDSICGKYSNEESDVRTVWNLDSSSGAVKVRDFMRRTGLTYEQTVNVSRLFGFNMFGADIMDKGYPDVDTQFINVDVKEGMVMLRRFLVIWRHVGWDMDKLWDFCQTAANGQLDENSLVHLYRILNPEHPNRPYISEVLSNLLSYNGIDPDDYIYSSKASASGGEAPDLEKCPVPDQLLKKLSNVLSFEDEFKASEELLEILKNQYGNKWKKKIKDIYDPVREIKRDALVAFVVESCQRKAFRSVPDWKDAGDIFDSLLVDVMMNSPMQTTRIKQATGAVQLFVQRCMLNLEDGMRVSAAKLKDSSSLDSWGQWSWMKNYRVWEANRKIFLFPENWIEPELRDNQTPFFKEFIDAADQVEATTENLSDALLEYLYKLDEVAHLEVCNIYRQIEKEANIDILHIIACTKATPTKYFYRTCDLNRDMWTPWEKVEIDISSKQMTFALYRGKLYLFWLNFTEKTLKPSSLPSDSDKSVKGHEAVKYYEIQLAWTVRKNGEWMSKTVSKQKLIHPWERPLYSYDLKSYLDKIGRLHLDVYISTSPEFNNAKVNGGSTNPEFQCRYSKTPYNVELQPWHSSTFLFEGSVTGVFMINMGANGKMSVDFINEYFGEEGRNIRKLDKTNKGPALLLPNGMHLKDNRLVNNDNNSRLYVGEDISKNSYNSRELLSRVDDPFQMVITQQTVQMDALQKGAMMFFQDSHRAYYLKTCARLKYKFNLFYHPYTSQFITILNQKGMDGLLTNRMQTLDGDISFNNEGKMVTRQTSFKNRYRPDTANVSADYPEETVDFSPNGAYGIYNWELFFHIPLTIACRLSANQNYEEAMKWFHYIFNPVEYTEGQTPQCYWITEPFVQNALKGENGTTAGRIETILKNITKNSDMLAAWKNNPFKPHIIAQFRTEVYQKQVVKKYIENLINWADDLFRQDTWETINEAVMLYLMAKEILGYRPEMVKDDSRTAMDALSFKDLSGNLDIFGNSVQKVNIVAEAMLTMENMADIQGFRGNESSVKTSEIPTLDMFYFNVPSNDALVGYWNTVEDRLFKIRNSMNIDGVVRTLALNAPEIDPAALVKATASGLSIGDLNMNAVETRPKYRFKPTLQKAIEICGEARAMGDKLLAAIEKEDAAKLTELRSQLEVKALEAATKNKKLEIESIKLSIKNLEISRDRAEIVLDHYENIEHLSAKEAKLLQMASSQMESLRTVTVLNQTSSVTAMIPSIVAGLQGVFSSPVAHGELFSGKMLAESLNFQASIISNKNQIEQQKSGIISTKSSYERRSDEWYFQAKTARKDLESLEKQIEGQEIRLAMAEQDLENHTAQIENSKAVYNLIKEQFSNKALYEWLKKDTAALYKKLYELAYSYAQKARVCYEFELGENAPAMVPEIKPDNWSQQYKGLMAGERLLTQLRDLEQSYLDNDKRCFELTKRISLSELMDVDAKESAFARLLRDGVCEVDIPEWIYDLDYPTHGNRRIKNVSITIPCVVGPNTNVNCTLTLKRHMKRGKNDTGLLLLGKVSDLPASEMPSIATSSAVNDSGVFELNFNGDKLMPFEGYGAVSRWNVSLPVETNHFDRSTISDVILNVTYYAQAYGAHPLNSVPFVRVVSARHEFPEQWHRCALQGGDLEIVLDEKMVQSYLRSKFSRFDLVAALKQTKDGGSSAYEDLDSGYEKNGKRITLAGAGNMISSGIEDILFILSCNS